jgi:mono/diheme cytochrome c family protein
MCHILTDAEAYGDTGPSLDGNPGLTKARVVGFVARGQEAMPSYSKLLSADEIDEVANYVMTAKK